MIFKYKNSILRTILIQICACIIFFIPNNKFKLFEIEFPENVEFGFWTFLIKLAIMVALAYVLQPKPKSPQKPRPVGLENFDIPTAEEGRPIQVLFGKKYITGPNVVWYGHLKSVQVWG